MAMLRCLVEPCLHLIYVYVLFSQTTNISHVFELPTDFATVLDVDKLRSFSRFSALGSAQGGAQFLRPCAAVGDHMMKLIADDHMLKFTFHDAEQHFLDWYFKYTRYCLPHHNQFKTSDKQKSTVNYNFFTFVPRNI